MHILAEFYIGGAIFTALTMWQQFDRPRPFRFALFVLGWPILALIVIWFLVTDR